MALCAWEKIDVAIKFKGSFTKIFQGISEPYAFLGKQMDAIQRQIRGKEEQQHLIKTLAFENANENRQAILHPIREKENVIVYLWNC